MIYTITFNPALDYIAQVENFEIGQINRTKTEKILPGGKGLNVSTVLKNLGLENRTSDKIKKEEYFTLDYTDVNKKLAKKREESLAFLKKSLESIEKSKTK